MKKIISLVLAFCMILMVGVVFAEESGESTEPASSPTYVNSPVNNVAPDSVITITGLANGDTVKFYQVLKYDQNATKGWSKTADFNLTDDQVNTILTTGIGATLAGTIGGMVPTTPTAQTYERTAASGAVSVANPVAGLYVAIIIPADPDTTYNPVFVGADYYTNKSGTWAVDTKMTYSDSARAKKDTLKIEKTATDYTHDHDDEVSFTVKYAVPAFAENYTDPTFYVSDKLSTGLVLLIDDDHPFTISPNTGVESNTATNGANSFKITYSADHLHRKDEVYEVTLTYYAKITNEAPFNVNAEKNEPGILIMDFVKGFNKWKFEDFYPEFTIENMEKMVKDQIDGKIKPPIKSEEIPEKQEKAVYKLVNKSFQKEVLDSKINVFVKFYSPNCPHCIKLEPAFNELAEKLKYNKNLIVAEYNLKANDFDWFRIRGYPTLILFKAGDKQNHITYNGDRTVEDMMNFVVSNLGEVKE